MSDWSIPFNPGQCSHIEGASEQLMGIGYVQEEGLNHLQRTMIYRFVPLPKLSRTYLAWRVSDPGSSSTVGMMIASMMGAHAMSICDVANSRLIVSDASTLDCWGNRIGRIGLCANGAEPR